MLIFLLFYSSFRLFFMDYMELRYNIYKRKSIVCAIYILKTILSVDAPASAGISQGNRAIYSQQNHQKGLYSVYDQGKYPCIGCIDSVEHHHRDDGKMPRPCPIGGRNNHCKGAAYKHHQRSQHTEVLGKRKAEEGEVEMNEVTQPDKYGIGNEEEYSSHCATTGCPPKHEALCL